MFYYNISGSQLGCFVEVLGNSKWMLSCVASVISGIICLHTVYSESLIL